MLENILQAVQLAKDEKRRKEEIKQRHYENEYRQIEDCRRLIDVKSEQLKTVSNLSALIAGFSMMILVESNLPDDFSTLPTGVLPIFGGISTLVVGLNLLTLMMTSLMLVSVLNFESDSTEAFKRFWHMRCEKDWHIAFRCFIYAVPLFMIEIALLAWIEFLQSRVTAILICVVVGVVLLVFVFYAFPSWGNFGSTPGLFHKYDVSLASNSASASAPSFEPSYPPPQRRASDIIEPNIVEDHAHIPNGI